MALYADEVFMMTPVTYLKRVLIIEDNPEFRFLFKTSLESLGCEVLEAEDGLAGCEMAEVIVPEVVLLDLTISKLHGFEVLKRLRSKIRTKDIPVIVLSVLNDPNDIKKSLELGANECIVKGSESPLKIAERCIGLFAERKHKPALSFSRRTLNRIFSM